MVQDFAKVKVSIFLGFFLFNSLHAQSTHSTLKDPLLLKKFQSISHKLMCTCGCNMPLAYCNHIGHCNAWPMRAAIEGLLLDGKSEEEILHGFIYGFGPLVESHPAFALTRSPEYNYLINRFQNGLGESGLTKPKGKGIWIFLLAGFFAIIFLSYFLLQKKIRKPKVESSLENEKELFKSLMEFAKKSQ